MVRVQPEKSRDNPDDEVMDYQFHQFGPPDNSSLSGEIKITTQPGMKRIVAFVLYGFLVLLLLILLMVTGIKFSQLNKEITDVKLHLESMNHAGVSSLSNSVAFQTASETTVQKEAQVTGICKDGWMSFRESCYLLSTTVTTWIKAQSLCITQGGHLLVLNNVEELDYISSVVQIYSNYWIGLVERHQEGHWTWVDGTDFASTPTFWDEGQPDNWAFRENGEDCGQLHASDRRKRKRWNDADCSLQYQYICESRA
ncbi:C-type lectin domain family 4 member E-like isoform X2 [Seriola dumerili]|uniref:C-type lectin domain family 4 member E-like isoform X2 n=1 Tax=Seriola dumerili TaxID=41447 RepID=UPI000BBE4B12|nr:C-type lectin domain family 4 member E-like isoform X2 [Seriola dumerili]